MGTGKTFLTSTVIEKITSITQAELRTDAIVTGDETLAYCFCEKGDIALNNESILRCLVKQLAVPATEGIALNAEILGQYDTNQSKGNINTPFNCDEIVDRIEKLVVSRSRVFLVIDGLDECEEPSRNLLLSDLSELLTRISFLWIFVSSRPYSDIREQLPTPHTSLSVDGNRTKGDIKQFIDKQLNWARTDLRPPPAGKILRGDGDLSQKIKQSISEKGIGMYVSVGEPLS